MYNNMSGRGGGGGQGGSFRSHGSGRGFSNRDNRRGGSFSGGGSQNFSQQQQQQYGPPPPTQQPQSQPQNFSGTFRGRHQNFARGGRHDTSGLPHGPKGDVSASSGFSVSKKDENRRTLTDFKIVGLTIPALGWRWGAVPDDIQVAEVKEEPGEATVSPIDQDAPERKPDTNTSLAPATSSGDADASVSAVKAGVEDNDTVKQESASTPLPPPPSRIRIYFHTPVTADDAHPISSQGSFTLGQSHDTVVRKGKRKKIEDDDGDLEEGRGPPPPPPQHSGFDHAISGAPDTDHERVISTADRASAAPIVTETASEGDWLMAAIGEEEGSGDGNTEVHAADGDNLHDIDAEGEPDDYEDGNDYEDVDAQMGGIDDDPSHIPTEGHLDEHAEAPSFEGGSVLPGLNGRNDSIANGSHTNGDHKSSLPSAPPHEGPNGSAAPSLFTKSSAIDHSVTFDVAAEPVVSTNEAAVDADKNISIQAQPPEPSLDIMETSEVTPTTDEHATAVAVTQTNGHLNVNVDETQLVDSGPDHPPSPTASTATLVLPSAHESTGPSEINSGDAQSTTTEPTRVPSANRLSISYAAATRRLVIDAEVVDKLKVFRQEARIEVHMNIEKDKAGQYKGILIEGATDSSAIYYPIELSADADEDKTVPPLSTAKLPLRTVLTAYLDKERPLSEPRWVKTGDVHDWLKSMFGRMFWVAGDAADGWEKKIEVMDADPPPTIWTVLEAWAVNSSVGQQTERQRFLRTHMTETDNILEILLRLVRGERASYSQSTPVISAPSVSGPLLSALSQGSAHGAQQTHVSLAVLAIFRVAVEFAKKVDEEKGKTEVEARVGEIIRCLPSHLIYKSLDGIFKEWRLEKKGSR
ncbi:hypothetical protein BDY19DRAFT_925029 [Irpex rosettiformis]|uniref:Uncharacterized protein n=1 Tax=Irpex rosettiformis TaxID=378272 RepID=A0ACB8UE65_9APHY|nr:hypothetical protein BDY19DRAFT_925029 [Irpex rosettiformis]